MTSLKELLKRECSYEPADATLDRFLALAHTINLAQDEVLIHPGQNDSNVYVVKGEREHLIPAVPEFILSTDADNGIITVHLIEGM